MVWYKMSNQFNMYTCIESLQCVLQLVLPLLYAYLYKCIYGPVDSRLPIRFFIHASVHWLINLHVQCMSTLPCICVSDDGSVAIRPPFAGSVIAQDI